MREVIAGKLIGASITRVEDERLLSGTGRYLADVVVPGMCHAAFLRSPYAHAAIRSIDVSAARNQPGVHAVLTGTDLAKATHPFIGLFAFEGLYQPSYHALATTRVRHVGDPVAIVIAESRHLAEDACELIDVDYEYLEPIASASDALRLAPIWPGSRSNVLYQTSQRFGNVDGQFAVADHIVTERFEQHRISNQPMETRGVLAEIRADTGELIVHSSTQSVHMLRWAIATLVGRQPFRRTLRQLADQRARTAAIGRGIRAYLSTRPAINAALKDLAPTMVKQAVRDPARMWYMTEALLGLMAKHPADLPRVVAGDIGGAFGAKSVVHREDVAVCATALLLGRSVRWVEDRNEHLTVGAQAREETMEVQAAVTSDGEVLAMRARLTMDAGAYLAFPFGAPMFARLIQTMFPGPYRLRALEFHGRVMATNKPPYVAYRGPWAAETWVRERMLDVIARHIGVDRGELRLRNMLRSDELPTRMVTGPTLDVRMSARQTLQTALELADFEHWDDAKRLARQEGRRVGLGFATYIEAAPGPPGYLDHIAPGFSVIVNAEPVRMVVEGDGSISVFTQQVPHGQGHETTLAQIVADEVGVTVDAVRVNYGNTKEAPFGVVGTGGSRSAAMAGGAVTLTARDIRQKVLDAAADLLEASPDDLVVERGLVHVRGTPSMAVTMSQIAAASETIEATQTFTGGDGGWAQATHVCWVEIDTETGLVRIPRYLVVEDCGDVINPAIVAGQIRGGVAQGIGAVLYEKAAYDTTAQFQAGTFMDYLLPTAMEIPEIEIHHITTSSDIMANYRGVGEGGMIGAPAAITNAIDDALADLGVRITEQYLPPARILELAGVVGAS